MKSNFDLIREQINTGKSFCADISKLSIEEIIEIEKEFVPKKYQGRLTNYIFSGRKKNDFKIMKFYKKGNGGLGIIDYFSNTKGLEFEAFIILNECKGKDKINPFLKEIYKDLNLDY